MTPFTSLPLNPKPFASAVDGGSPAPQYTFFGAKWRKMVWGCGQFLVKVCFWQKMASALTGPRRTIQYIRWRNLKCQHRVAVSCFEICDFGFKIQSLGPGHVPKTGRFGCAGPLPAFELWGSQVRMPRTFAVPANLRSEGASLPAELFASLGDTCRALKFRSFVLIQYVSLRRYRGLDCIELLVNERSPAHYRGVLHYSTPEFVNSESGSCFAFGAGKVKQTCYLATGIPCFPDALSREVQLF